MVFQIKRTKWTIRLVLLLPLILMITVAVILLRPGKHHINPETAQELLGQMQAMTAEELERLFGSPDLTFMQNGRKQMTWVFDEDSLFDSSQFTVVLRFDADGQPNLNATTFKYPFFSKFQWERLKKRLGFAWKPIPQ